VDVSALAAFDHGDDGLDLGTTAIGVAIEPDFHQSAVATAGQLVGGPAVLGGNDRTNAMLVASELVVTFRIVTGIGRQLREAYEPSRGGHERAELSDIGTGTTAGAQRKHEMIVGTADHAQLGVMMVNDCFPGVFHPTSAAHEVATGTGAFQAGRVDRRAFYPPSPAQLQADGGLEEFSRRCCSQQATRRLLKRGEVGNLPESQHRHEGRIVGQMGRQAPVVGSQKVLQHEAGEELMLRELFGTIPMCVLRKCPPRCCQRR
jgi:hypothetical protein